ncbi:MAG: hypothetical protein V3W41_15705 [Planctomycetota bacterium]
MTTQQGLLGSSLAGFGAILSGKSTAARETWTWKGDLLNVANCGKLVAKFQLVNVKREGRKNIAYIRGSIVSGWPKQKTGKSAPQTKYELWYSLSDDTPLKSRLSYKSKSRTSVIETTAYWEPIQQKAQLTSLKRKAAVAR